MSIFDGLEDMLDEAIELVKDKAPKVLEVALTPEVAVAQLVVSTFIRPWGEDDK